MNSVVVRGIFCWPLVPYKSLPSLFSFWIRNGDNDKVACRNASSVGSKIELQAIWSEMARRKS